MQRFLMQTVLGIFLLLVGAVCFYFFLNTLNNAPNMFFLLGAFVSVGVGAYFAIHAGKSDAMVTTKPADIPAPAVAEEPSVLQKQNELVNSWKKTMEDRDKLKMLEISAKAEES